MLPGQPKSQQEIPTYDDVLNKPNWGIYYFFDNSRHRHSEITKSLQFYVFVLPNHLTSYFYFNYAGLTHLVQWLGIINGYFTIPISVKQWWNSWLFFSDRTCFWYLHTWTILVICRAMNWFKERKEHLKRTEFYLQHKQKWKQNGLQLFQIRNITLKYTKLYFFRFVYKISQKHSQCQWGKKDYFQLCVQPRPLSLYPIPFPLPLKKHAEMQLSYHQT